MLLLILLFSSSSAQYSGEESTPASLLRPRDFNHHTYLANYVDRDTEPTKQGPVLFPNDAPPPPRPPLIVTSRPLIESIARSELNPTPPTIANNSIAEATQVKPEFRLRPEFLRERRPDYLSPDTRPFFKLKPALLAKVQGYKPFLVSTPDYGLYGKKGDDARYGDYDEHPPPTLPPIYQAIADHAQQKVSKLKHIPDHTKPRLFVQKKEPVYPHRYQHNDVRDEVDYDHDSNYAFSYTVKDHKTGDDFSHSQQSSGSATNGEYRVRLPDGRMQIVSYTADENGYKADVRYDDEDKTAGNSIDHNYDYDKHAGHRHDYVTNKHDYPINKHDYVTNKHDYPINKHDYVTNKHDYPLNKHDYATNIHDYPPIKQDYNANSLAYGPFSQSNAVNEHEYDRTNYDYVPNNSYVTKPPPVKENFNEYSDLSKEYYNTDYSLEYDGKDDNYTPHKSKFSAFAPKQSKLGTIVVPAAENQNYIASSTLKPSYEELKPLFVNKNLYNAQPTQNYLKNVEINVPSTTPNPLNYDGTTENVVLIGRTKPNLYTNIRNLPLTVTPSPVPVTSPSTFVTPSSYLLSTISSLKNGQVPVLSGRFIDKINKYLTFT